MRNESSSSTTAISTYFKACSSSSSRAQLTSSRRLFSYFLSSSRFFKLLEDVSISRSSIRLKSRAPCSSSCLKNVALCMAARLSRLLSFFKVSGPTLPCLGAQLIATRSFEEQVLSFLLLIVGFFKLLEKARCRSSTRLKSWLSPFGSCFRSSRCFSPLTNLHIALIPSDALKNRTFFLSFVVFAGVAFFKLLEEARLCSSTGLKNRLFPCSVSASVLQGVTPSLSFPIRILR